MWKPDLPGCMLQPWYTSNSTSILRTNHLLGHGLNIYITVKTKMLLWPKVCCFSSMLDTNCYCKLVTNVVYDNFQDILVPIQCSREYKKFRASPTFQLFIHAIKTTNLWSQQHSLWMHSYMVTSWSSTHLQNWLLQHSHRRWQCTST